MTTIAKQGQKYALGHHECIALETGNRTVKVQMIDHELPYPLHAPTLVHVSQLTALPMRYYGMEARE